MIVTKYPNQEEWAQLLARPMLEKDDILGVVRPIVQQVREHGDGAIRELEARFDHCELNQLEVTDAEFAFAEQVVDVELKQAIQLAANQISAFHASQKMKPQVVESCDGVRCWQEARAIEKVGLYIPGGRAPLFSTVLMLALPAQIAGCRQIVLCTPPNSKGEINPAILFAAQLAGVTEVYKVGGAQAIAAMAYGTESVPEVYKIFGPGNQFVTAAKQLVSLRDCAIDMPAGPSEVEVLADETANPVFVAADLLSQCEHGPDSQAILITTCESLLAKVQMEIGKQLAVLPRKEIAAQSLLHSRIILVRDVKEAIAMTNRYAPEHLIVQMANYNELVPLIIHAGSVFLGSYSCESAGDYASGTNHTLPTNGYAKAYSGVNLDSFIRKVTFQELTAQGIQNIGPAIETMAAAEQLDGHRNAVTVRLKEVIKK